MWQAMATAYGPAHRLAGTLDDDSRTALADQVAAIYERYRTPDGIIRMPRPYLIITGSRR
jgi:hypothetical protein